MDDSDYEASKKIAVGSVVKATASRNWMFHKKAFALMNIGFNSQDKIASMEVYRKLLTIRAGFFDLEGGYSLPHSLAFDKMSSEVFERWFNATLEVISQDTQTAPSIIQREIEGFY